MTSLADKLGNLEDFNSDEKKQENTIHFSIIVKLH